MTSQRRLGGGARGDQHVLYFLNDPHRVTMLVLNFFLIVKYNLGYTLYCMPHENCFLTNTIFTL